MGGPLQPQSLMPLQPVQQGVASQGAGAKASLPSTWADPTVNISLDFLGPGMQPPKPSQPTLSTLQQGERNGGSDMKGDTVARLSFKAHTIKSNVIFKMWHFYSLSLFCHFQATRCLPACCPRDFPA